MQKLSIALLGKKGMLGREKPGILSSITTFSDVLQTYAQYGKDGAFPMKDKDGNIIPGKFVTSNEIAKNMLSALLGFMSSMNTELNGKGAQLEQNAKNVENKIKVFSGVIDQFDKMAKSQEGLEKMANSMGLLATNVQLLVTSMGALDTDKLQKLTTITANHAVITKGIPITAPTTTSSASKTTASPDPDWDKIAETIGNKIAAKISAGNNGEFQFRFMDPESLKGVFTIKK
jgi:hypothetical protein